MCPYWTQQRYWKVWYGKGGNSRWKWTSFMKLKLLCVCACMWEKESACVNVPKYEGDADWQKAKPSNVWPQFAPVFCWRSSAGTSIRERLSFQAWPASNPIYTALTRKKKKIWFTEKQNVSQAIWAVTDASEPNEKHNRQTELLTTACFLTCDDPRVFKGLIPLSCERFRPLSRMLRGCI